MPKPIQIGEVVQLKTGGPEMSVQKLNDSVQGPGQAPSGTALCSWFDSEGKLHQVEFAIATLTRAAEKKHA